MPLNVLDVVVVGAGLAGLSCARALADAGRSVSLFDKARGVGGRMATRRGEEANFDHGAQYFTARDPAFVAEVARWQAAGAVAPWEGHIMAYDGAGFAQVGPETRYVGTPGMSAVCRHLLGNLNFASQHRLASLEHDGDHWSLDFAEGETALARDLVLALPAPQTAALLVDEPDLHSIAASVPMAPCWAVMLQFAEPLPLEFAGCFVNQGPLGWIANNSSKPGRKGAEAWLLHATPAWSKAHVSDKEDTVGAALAAAFVELTGIKLSPVEVSAHRWLYSQADQPLTQGCVFDASRGIGLAGDWLNGSRVEGAWLSGQLLAANILAR